MGTRGRQAGFTLTEVLIGLAILTVVSSSIYFAYASVIEIVQAAQYNSASLSAIESHIEQIRNMRYEDVGVIGGVPAGKLNQEETVMIGPTALTMHTYVRNIDDAFDGILGGSPNDTAPADYKLVEIQITCDSCPRYNIISMTTYVAPKNLESSSKNGNLFVRVFDAAGAPVAGATVHVTNTDVNPPIDLTDITNADGYLQLVDTATSSAGYHLTAGKSGYTSDQTYPPGNPANPLKPDATVASQQLTVASLEIDLVSTLTVKARDRFCAPTGNFDVLMTGGKLIGTSPDVPKYSSVITTTSEGTASLASLEWDTYGLVPTDTDFDIAGTLASLSLTINPGSNHSMVWMTASRSGNALLVSVTDQAGQPLNGATVHVSKAGYDATETSGEWSLSQSTWQEGTYDSKSAFLDTSAPDALTLLMSNGSYASASTEWIISNTFDIGTSSAEFGTLNWNPVAQPAQTGADSFVFQVAGNADNTTWNWVGPDGTASTFFTASGQQLPASLNGSRFVRYRAYLRTADDSATPTLEDVSIRFSYGCVMPGQSYFNGMSAGTYTVEVSKAGLQTYTVNVPVSDTWQRIIVPMIP